MKYITSNHTEAHILGSIFWGTGGGLSYQPQKQIFEEIFSKRARIPLQPCDAFDARDILASVYAVGDPSRDLSLGPLIKRGLKEYQNLSGISVSGIIPGEIGAEPLAFQVSAYTGLPVADSDLVGGRAAPEISMDAFTVFGWPLTPLLAVSANEKQIFLKGDAYTADEIESTLRQFFSNNGGAGLLVGYPIRAGTYRKQAMTGTISRAYETGTYLQAKDLSGLAHHLGAHVREATVTDVSLESGGDFYGGWVQFTDGMSLWVKNENITLKKGNRTIHRAPAPIVLLNARNIPIHNTKLGRHKGKQVTILTMPADGYWNTKEAQKLWKSAFA